MTLPRPRGAPDLLTLAALAATAVWLLWIDTLWLLTGW